jgi:membrane protein
MLLLIILLILLLGGGGGYYGYGRWGYRGGAGAGLGAVLKGASQPATGVIATGFGLLALMFSASSVFVELHDALNMIWQVPLRNDLTNAATAVRFIKDRFYSFVMVAVAGSLLLVSLLLSTWVSGVERSAPRVLALLFAFCVIAALFAAVYKTVPDVTLKWSDVVLGAAVTSLLFLLGKELIALYFAKTSFRSAYGTAASPLIVLLWAYYSTQLFFGGAEFTKVYTNALGSRS